MEKVLNTNGSLAMRQQERRVITIETIGKPDNALLRVAAYTRVSTSSEDQLNSLGAQIRYYSELIGAHEDWKLVDIYADEGITGTRADKRDEFQRMMSDCRHGLINRILTKSISRFARNTVDCLAAIRELKSIGVSVFFEKENLDTGTLSSEMLVAVMATLAQQESESISENLRWSYQKRMEAGEFNTCKAPYGFRLVHGDLVIEESEAKIVQTVFKMHLSGFSKNEIAKELRQRGVPTRGEVKEWKATTIGHMLRNMRYAGNALLGMRITTESLPHREIANHGERPQYYVRGSNPAIISQETFEKAQKLIERRQIKSGPKKEAHPLNQKIVCSCCGAVFKRQQPRDVEYWICYSRYKSKELCSMPTVTTVEIEGAFCRLFYKLKHQGMDILTDIISAHKDVNNRRMLWHPRIIELNKTISDLTNQNQLLSTLKQQGLVDPDIFINRSNDIANQLQKAKQEKNRIMKSKENDVIPRTQDMIDILAGAPEYIGSFDLTLFDGLVDKIIVNDGAHITFRMKNGLELVEEIEKRTR